MLSVENVATPALAATVAVPESVPPPGLVPIATLMFPENPVAVLPLASCAVTSTPGVIGAPATVFVGWTLNTSAAAVPGVMSNAALVALPAPVAVSVYPGPALLIDRLVKLATPPAAATVSVPDSVPPPGFVPIATVIFPVNPVAVLPLPSSALTWTAGVIAAPAVVVVGCTENTSCVAAPAVTVMVPEVTALSPVAPKVRVRSPAVPVIAKFVKVATPPAVVMAVSVPPSVPPPVAIATVTVTPDWLTGLPAPSRSCTTGCCANATPLCAEAEGWVVMVSWVTAPAPTVIVPVVAPVLAVALKLNAGPPAFSFNATSATEVSPLSLLVALPISPSVPPPVAIAAVTVTPDWLTALPEPSRSCTTGCCANAIPLWADAEGWVVIVSCVAAPAPTVIVPDVAPVSPVDRKSGVQGKSVDLGGRRIIKKTPPAVVTAVRVPSSVPPPVAIAAVTVTRDWFRGLPVPSRSCTTGCCANATPLWAEAEGCVVSVSSVAAPAPTVIVPDVAPVSPVALKLSVRSPAVPVIARFVKGAAPRPVGIEGRARPPP